MSSRDGAIDRVGPTRRPDHRVVGTQRWRDLLFLHWTFPPEVIRPLVPSELELDLLDGVAVVGLVPFAMEGVRPWWWPPGTGMRFLETNVRTYVVHRGRPGVWFFSLDAANLLAVHAARTFWGLPYHHARMRLDREGDARQYETARRGSTARCEITARPTGELGASAPDSDAFFLLERYLLFVARGGAIREGQVSHAPYPVFAAEVERVEDSLLAAGGVPGPLGAPTHVHWSPGVDVEIFGLRRIGIV